MREMKITDHGKDYGFGRYKIVADGIELHSNEFGDVAEIALKFGEPCDGCNVAPVNCPGMSECNLTYGRWSTKDTPKIGDKVLASMNGEDWFNGTLIEIVDVFASYGVRLDGTKETSYFVSILPAPADGE